jgi:hypothetical protein
VQAIAEHIADSAFVVYHQDFCHVPSQPEVGFLTKPPMDFHKDFTNLFVQTELVRSLTQAKDTK